MTIKNIVGSSLLAGLLFVSTAWATPLHRHGCENPLTESELQVCWDVVGDPGEVFSPFPEMFFMPIAMDQGGEPQLLADYTRSVFRQLLPSGMADNLYQEWAPVTNLEDMLLQARLRRLTYVLWIAPRVLRASSASSPGIVDWDIYVIRSAKLLRTLRIRVESHPKRNDKSVESGTAVATLLTATGAVLTNPFASAAAVTGAVATARSGPPEAGRSLELMTELAVRQLTVLFQFPVENLQSEMLTKPKPVKKIQGWVDKVFAHK